MGIRRVLVLIVLGASLCAAGCGATKTDARGTDSSRAVRVIVDAVPWALDERGNIEIAGVAGSDLWLVATFGSEVWRVDGPTRELSSPIQARHLLSLVPSGRHAWAVEVDPLTMRSRLKSLDTRTGTQTLQVPAKCGLVGARSRAFENDIWLDCERGLIAIDERTGEVRERVLNDEIAAVIEANGSLWIVDRTGVRAIAGPAAGSQIRLNRSIDVESSYDTTQGWDASETDIWGLVTIGGRQRVFRFSLDEERGFPIGAPLTSEYRDLAILGDRVIVAGREKLRVLESDGRYIEEVRLVDVPGDATTSVERLGDKVWAISSGRHASISHTVSESP